MKIYYNQFNNKKVNQCNFIEKNRLKKKLIINKIKK